MSTPELRTTAETEPNAQQQTVTPDTAQKTDQVALAAPYSPGPIWDELVARHGNPFILDPETSSSGPS